MATEVFVEFVDFDFWMATILSPYVEPPADHALADWIKFLNTKLEQQRWSWHLGSHVVERGWSIRKTKIMTFLGKCENSKTCGEGWSILLGFLDIFTYNEGVSQKKEDINTSLQHPHFGHHNHLDLKIIDKSALFKITSKEMRDSSENMTPPATSKLMMVAFMQPLMVEMLVIIIDYQSKLTPLDLDEMQRHFH